MRNIEPIEVLLFPHTDAVFDLHDLETATSDLPDHEYSLHLTTTNQARLGDEAVLVFNGLPNSLLRSFSSGQLDFSRSNLSSGLEGRLLASFTHHPLPNVSFMLHAPFLSVLYYGNSAKPAGFNLTVMVTGMSNNSNTSSCHNRVSHHTFS